MKSETAALQHVLKAARSLLEKARSKHASMGEAFKDAG